MEHAFVLCSRNIITFDHLPPDFMGATGIVHSSPDETQEPILAQFLRPGQNRLEQSKSSPLAGYGSRDPLPENQKI